MAAFVEHVKTLHAEQSGQLPDLGSASYLGTRLSAFAAPRESCSGRCAQAGIRGNLCTAAAAVVALTAPQLCYNLFRQSCMTSAWGVSALCAGADPAAAGPALPAAPAARKRLLTRAAARIDKNTR